MATSPPEQEAIVLADEHLRAALGFIASLLEANGKCELVETVGGGLLCRRHKQVLERTEHSYRRCRSSFNIGRDELVRALRQLDLEHDEAVRSGGWPDDQLAADMERIREAERAADKHRDTRID